MNVLLTFDLEEFDIPEEYGTVVEFQNKIKVSTDGLIKVMDLLIKHNITCTFFTTATYALQKEELIKAISQKHEIASHGFYHSSFNVSDLKSSKEALEKIINKPVTGFRMARLAPVDDMEIEKAGYEYNSSMNPTYIPGRYNNLDKPRTAFYVGNVLNIPTSVSPALRVPLFWLSFKNFPLWYFKSLVKKTLKRDKVVSLYFHPWEFTEIKNYGLPKYISKHSGDKMLQRLEETILYLKPIAEFVTMNEYVRDFKNNK
jgi:peptidoglycan/xylan/chitin deacetylase (PgdA/CDA1 family)